MFILATTEVHKIPATVLSRCQRHEFRRVPVAQMVPYLEARRHQEGLTADPSALALIARQATGSLRDAISLLDQLASTGEEVTLERAEAVLGTAGGELVASIIQAIAGADAGGGMAAIQRSLDAGSGMENMLGQLRDMQKKLEETRKQLAEETIEASSGRGERSGWS